jgi:hypothetical protein
MQGQGPGLLWLVQLGITTVFGSGFLYVFGMFCLGLVAGAGFGAFGALLLLPFIVLAGGVICLCSALPSWVMFQAAFRGGLVLGFRPRAALHASLALVTLICSMSIAWGVQLLSGATWLALAVFGVGPQVALVAALILLPDGLTSKAATP